MTPSNSSVIHFWIGLCIIIFLKICPISIWDTLLHSYKDSSMLFSLILFSSSLYSHFPHIFVYLHISDYNVIYVQIEKILLKNWRKRNKKNINLKSHFPVIITNTHFHKIGIVLYLIFCSLPFKYLIFHNFFLYHYYSTLFSGSIAFHFVDVI